MPGFATPEPEPVSPEPTRTVEFWTIEANEGRSAGGHAAIRIGETIHHVEHRGDGLLRHRRDDRVRFERAYRGRGNRGIDTLTLALSPAQTQRLEQALRTRTLEHDLELRALDESEASLEWTEQTLEKGRLVFDLPGLGLFDPRHSADPAAAPNRPTRSIAEALRIARARQDEALTAWRIAGAEDLPVRIRDLRDAVATRVALELVASRRPLREDFIRPLPTGPSLTDSDRRLLRQIHTDLGQRLARLVASPRADRGLALLLTWARLEVARRSLAQETWLVLDGFAEAPPEGGPRRPPAPPLPEAWRRARADEADARLDHALQQLRARPDPAHLESRLDRLERAAHTARHRHAHTSHRAPEPETPLSLTRALERPGALVEVGALPPDLLPILERHRSNLKTRSREARRRLEKAQGYDLVARNCVTELLGVLEEQALLPPDARPLGAFAPRRAQAWLARNAPVTRHAHRASARRRSLNEARTRESGETEGAAPSLALALRESNTLTSRLYRPHADDSAFLVFTSDAPFPVRPLFGVTNLAWGAGTTAAGLVTSPFDRGARLGRGLRGMAMSLPELVFVPIRKGSYPVTPPDGLLGLD